MYPGKYGLPNQYFLINSRGNMLKSGVKWIKPYAKTFKFINYDSKMVYFQSDLTSFNQNYLPMFKKKTERNNFNLDSIEKVIEAIARPWLFKLCSIYKLLSRWSNCFRKPSGRWLSSWKENSTY